MSGARNPIVIGLLLVAVLLAASMTQSTRARSGVKEQPGWIIEQKHQDGGTITIYIARNRIKIVFWKAGFCLLAREPEHNVFIFRPTEKTIWIGSPEQLSPGALFNPFIPPQNTKSLPVIVLKPGEDLGPDSKHRYVQLLGEGKQGSIHYDEYSTRTSMQKRIVFRITHDIDAGPLVSSVLCRLYELPEMNGVPVYVRANSLKNQSYSAEVAQSRGDIFSARIRTPDVRLGPVIVVDTHEARRADLDQHCFAVPMNYKTKKGILDVTYSTDQKDSLNSLINNIGFTTKTGESTKPDPALKRK